ncbi:MAG: 4Fe-4S dicluster domain-containing protein [Elusimicrobiota bacterium]|nr:4Fe-4S dicluster domain-containing protein [Elusimicrobiota bacterium]
MSLSVKFILKEDILEFLNTLSVDNNIFCLTDELIYVKFISGNGKIKPNIDTVRAIIPLKSFFLTSLEELKLPEKLPKKRNIIFGVKSCDLRAKKILDELYLKGVCSDPFYELHNNNTLIFSSDCPEPVDSCFCNLVGGKPYCDGNGIEELQFDLNFSAVKSGYVVEIGSDEGEKIVNQAHAFFRDVDLDELAQRDKNRKNALDKLDKINSEFSNMKLANLQNILNTKFQSDYWKDAAKNCVQCTGCNNICPSCYCFYLTESDGSKIRFLDACHYTNYARVAGGLNPRGKVYERFRNRYECKFNYRMTNFGIYGCSGCGRCISVCPGKIDIRKVVNQLVS